MTRVSVRLLVAAALCAASAMVFGSLASASGSQIPRIGTGVPQTGAFVPSSGEVGNDEFAFDDEDGPDAYNGTISLSSGSGGGPNVTGAKKAKSNPTLNTSFEGLNFYQQRYARGGNQFSIEPPDQGLCVGNGFELEAINDVLNVYNTSGQSVLPDNTATNIVGGFPRNVNHAVDLNSFYGYPPAVNRTTGVQGPELDRSELHLRRADAALVRHRPDARPVTRTTSLNLVNHLDLAVSKTSDPTGSLEHLQDRRDERRHEHRSAEPGAVPRRLPAHRRRRERHLPHDQRLPVVLQRLRRRADLRVVEGAARRRCGDRDHAAHRHVRHGQCPERDGLDAAGLHGLAGAVARHRLVQHQQRRHRVLPELERRRRDAEADLRHRRNADVDTARGVDDDQHLVAELGVAGGQPVEPGPAGWPVRRPAEAAAARLRLRAGHERAAGLLPERHDNGHRSRASGAGGCSSAPGRPARSSRGRTRTTPACSR